MNKNDKFENYELERAFGYEIVVVPDDMFIKGYRQNKKHRKRRINKKWLKRYGVTPEYFESDCYIASELRKIICSKRAYERIKTAIESHGSIKP